MREETYGLYYKHFMIVNDDHKWHSWCHNLKHHFSVINYAPRVVNYAPRGALYRCHLWLSLTIVTCNINMLIVQAIVSRLNGWTGYLREHHRIAWSSLEGKVLRRGICWGSDRDHDPEKQKNVSSAVKMQNAAVMHFILTAFFMTEVLYYKNVAIINSVQ